MNINPLENFRVTENTLIAVDLDGTLVKSKLAIEPDMAAVVCKWLKTHKFVVISGAMFSQLKIQILNDLPTDAHLENLILLPTTGQSFFEFKNNEWTETNPEKMPEADIQKIFDAFKKIPQELIPTDFNPTNGPQLQNRGGQVSFSAIGQDAPYQEKYVWDPDTTKRRVIISELEKYIPEFEIKLGGTTTIDITPKGIDKGFAIKKLVRVLGIQEQDVVFFGDRIIPGGNDFAATNTNALCIAVENPEETQKLITTLVQKVQSQ